MDILKYLCCCYCRGENEENFKLNVTNVSPETKRRHQLEAAEKRKLEQETRGIKNPAKVKMMQEKRKQHEKLERETASKSGGNESGLKWQMG